jgi:hypothetical protein
MIANIFYGLLILIRFTAKGAALIDDAWLFLNNMAIAKI